MKLLKLLAIPLLAISLAGCPKGTKQLAVASDTIAHGLDAAQQASKLAVADGIITPTDDANFEVFLAKVATAGQILDAGIRANESAATLAPKVNSFLDAFNSLNTQGVLGIKKPTVKAAISTALTGAEAAVAVIAASVGK
jgi:hypothetical protein